MPIEWRLIRPVNVAAWSVSPKYESCLGYWLGHIRGFRNTGYIGKKIHGIHAELILGTNLFRIDILGYQVGKLVIFIPGNNGVQDIKGKH